MAGENRIELEKVLEYYRNDSEKLAAAHYLIENMHGKYADDNRPAGDYSILFQNWNRLLSQGIHNKQQVFDSLVDHYGLKSQNKKLSDLKYIKADFLINNIERAFEVKNYPWNKNIPFDRFCEEILPYRLDTEPLEYWRDKVLSQFRTIIDSLISVPVTDPIEVCTTINSLLKKEWEGSFSPTTLPAMNYTMLMEAWTGTCRERSALGVFTMRALGVPVTRDFTPQWPNRRMGHNWNTVTDTTGNHIVFMATESNPGEPHEAGQKMSKVYRITYKIQTDFLKLYETNENIYSLFSSPIFKDVSDEYFCGATLTIKTNKNVKSKIAYLTVFDNKIWTPVTWKFFKKGKVDFTKMGKEIVYLPIYYSNQVETPLDYPLLIDKDGITRHFIPNKEELRTVKLLRKYPLLMNPKYLTRMRNGKFQGANNSDFKNAELLYTIPDNPDLYFQEIQINSKKKFQYVRYLSPDSSHCNIAELEFYNDSGSILKGNIIGTSGSYLNDPNYTIDKAFDGDPLTFIDTAEKNGGWVGLELARPTQISKIRFLPRNDDNTITIGHLYELFYWDVKGWISLGKQIATEQVLIYSNVPSNALLLLKNHSKGKEERIFTYENEKQIWW